MQSIIDFATDMSFQTLWGGDICKLLILYFMCKAIMMLAKVVINWRI